jgi:hypothetical protein
MCSWGAGSWNGEVQGNDSALASTLRFIVPDAQIRLRWIGSASPLG